MVTIKGFQGLNTENSLQIGGNASRSRVGFNNTTVNNSTQKNELSVSDSPGGQAVLSDSDGIALNLTAADQTNLTRYGSIQSATTALSDIITNIQSLTEQYQNTAAGSKVATAISNEITALTAEYNTILQSSGRYTTADLEAFSDQVETVNAASSEALVELTATTSSLTPITSSINTINTAIAPTLNSLSSLSSVSAGIAPSISSLEAAIADLDLASTAVSTSLFELGNIATTSTTVANQLGIVQADLAEVQASVASESVPASLLASSLAIDSSIGNYESLIGNLATYNSSSSANNLEMINFNSLADNYSESAINQSNAAVTESASATSYASLVEVYVGFATSSFELGASLASAGSSIESYANASAAYQSSYNEYIQSSGANYGDSIEQSLSNEIVQASQGHNVYTLSSSELASQQSDLTVPVGSYNDASYASASHIQVAIDYAAGADSYSSEFNILIPSSIDSLTAANVDLDSSIAAAVIANSGYSLSSSSLNNDLIAVDGSLASFIDPLLLASSATLVSSSNNLTSSLAAIETTISSEVQISSILNASSEDISLSSSDLSNQLAPLVTSETAINNNIGSFSLSIATSITALSSFSSTSSVLARREDALTAGLASLGTEAVALAAASSAAAVEVASSSSSPSLNSLASNLKAFDIDDGIKINLATTTLIAVTNEILENRQIQLAGAEGRLSAAAKGIEISANALAAQPTEISLETNRPQLSPSQATKFSEILASSILANKSEALGAIGQLDGKTVLALVGAGSLTDKEA